MVVLLIFAFLSGLVTILAPCIWPLLPIVLSSSVSGGVGHKRPLGITFGIMVSFLLFTLFISYLISVFHFNPNTLRIVAVVIIAILGVCMVIPGFNAVLELAISRFSGLFGRNRQLQNSGFLGGFATGLSLGIVWSPCAGPILAAIATLAATNHISFQVFLVALFYVIGVGIPLFIFAYAGQKFITNSKRLSPHLGRVQQLFGVIMILTAIIIYTNKAQEFQLALTNRFPALNTVFNGFENSDVVSKELQKLGSNAPTLEQNNDLFNVTSTINAPEFAGITKWLNSPDGSIDSTPLTMKALQGKVVLVDFWTYTCINCIRTLPHVTSWYDKYHDKGFVVVGVHTPEFAFEKETSNVLSAIKQYNIHYPVAQDNDFGTWNAYSNQYWPAEYLVDAKGVVRRVHFGEGEYDKMEEAIQALLKEKGVAVADKIDSISDDTPHGEISRETYVGAERMEYLADVGSVGIGTRDFPSVNKISPNSFAFSGRWDIEQKYAITVKDSHISYNFVAGNVYLVMRPGSAKNARAKVLMDGKPLDKSVAGKDVVDGEVTIDTDRLYDLVNLHGKTENHALTLEFLTSGIELYAFTFGN